MTDSVPLVFECEGSRLVGIVEKPQGSPSKAVLVVVGGPQYRVGSHRLFTFLCRDLATQGIVAMRFDHRGIGDSDGSSSFETISPDIRAAVDALVRAAPSVTEIVIWGLCDGASAAMMYAASDTRITGLVLLNPWARDEQTLAKSYFRGYYVRRVLSRTFWSELFRGRVKIGTAITSLFRNARRAVGGQREEPESGTTSEADREVFQRRMMDGLARFEGRVLFVLSDEDMTADEFRTFVNSQRKYKRLLRRENTTTCNVPGADHTFSSARLRDDLIRLTANWTSGYSATRS